MKPMCGLLLVALSGALAAPMLANVGPDLMNYQGVLRDSAGSPIDGAHAMVFRFLDGGTNAEILVDGHEGPIAVTVTGGLFSVQLGGGVVSDGAGPGTYTALSQVFRDFSHVLLRVQINGETLAPDMRVLAASYAHNATYLNGVFESQFLRSDENDTAVGKIYFAGNPSGPGISQGSVYISPIAADPDDTLVGISSNALDRFKVDAEGDTFVGGGFRVANAVFVDPVAPFLGVGRSDRVTGSDVFSVRRSTSAGQYGGMYVETTNAGGWPFYGYATNDTARAWHYLDGATGAWKLYNNGSVRLTVDGNGHVGIGTTSTATYALRVQNGPVYITNQGDEEALIADAGYGVRGFGATAGGYFQDADSLTYANVGSGIYKIIGTGTVSFVQNHPEDPSSVIVYAAPEGDESATYTRGSARLTDGVARVALGPTFRWVTNPDIGLTAHVTPRGEPVALSVEAVSTTELVVRGPEGSDAAFDYAVWGLRIGFEEAAILQEKVEGAPIPAMSEHREMYGRRPDVKRFNALERFRGMAGGGAEPVDLRRSGELIAAIGEAFPGEDERPDASAPRSLEPDRIESDARVDPKEVPEAVPPLQPALQPVSEPVVAGDVLVVDRDRPGALRLGRDRADATVIGVALADATADADGGLRALVASYGIVTVRADAGYGAIRPGDLLTTSATPGHAMRAMDALPGTLAGKALDGLEAGTGTIRMVVLLR